MVQNKYVFDPYPLQVTMQRLAENLKARWCRISMFLIPILYR